MEPSYSGLSSIFTLKRIEKFTQFGQLGLGRPTFQSDMESENRNLLANTDTNPDYSYGLHYKKDFEGNENQSLKLGATHLNYNPNCLGSHRLNSGK